MKTIDDKIIEFIMSIFKFFQKIIHHVKLGDYKEEVKEIIVTDSISVCLNNYPDAKLKLYYPNQNIEKLPLIIYIHGGGWSAGSEKKVSKFVKLFAKAGYIVANVDYSLAPEYPYPVAINQIMKVIEFLILNSTQYKIDDDKIFIAGHSAGAHLAAQAGLIITSKKYQKIMNIDINIAKNKIKGLLLFSGVYDIETVNECNFPGFELMGWSYTKTKKFIEYEKINELSITKYITKEFPKCFITVGNKDKLEKQSFELKEKLIEKNIKYTDLFWTDDNVNLGHHYIYNLKTTSGKTFYNKAIEFLSKVD